MSDEIENSDAEEEVVDSSGTQAGERLAEARRKQQITVVEVAKELHLDERKVRALESNDFEVLGAPVFAKGHLKKYAQLVGVSIDDVMADYYQLNRSAAMPPVVGKVRKPATEIRPGPWLAIVIVIIVVAAAYWYFVARSPQSTSPPVSTIDTESAEEEAPVVDRAPPSDAVVDSPAPDEPVTEATDEPIAPLPAATEPVATSEPPAPEIAAGDLRLSMSFSGDCWTEITDASGRRLFFDLGRDGRSVSVTGQAPLSVLFGNADNVSISVNGEDYPIAAANRRGQTARMTITAP